LWENCSFISILHHLELPFMNVVICTMSQSIYKGPIVLSYPIFRWRSSAILKHKILLIHKITC
jgi:hypothetical protein